MWQGGPFCYVSKKLSHVGHHAMHNEYMALAEAGKSIVWMRQLLTELDHDYLLDTPTVLYGDNNAANSLTSEHFVSSGNQYIYLPYHAIKEWTELGMIKVARKASCDNISDLFTKNVSAGTVKKLLDRLCGYHTDALHAHMTRLLHLHDDRESDVLYALMSRMEISIDDRYAVCMIEF